MSKYKLIPSYPCRDLDGAPHPGCDHQHQTTDLAEIAVLQGVGLAILKSGIPKSLVRAGEIVDTTWGCAGNRKMKTRKAFICEIEVALVRHPRSMFYRPQLRYVGWHVDKEGNPIKQPGGMALTQFTCSKGEWQIAEGEWLWPSYNLEWISPLTGQMQRVKGQGVHFIREFANRRPAQCKARRLLHAS